MVRHLYHLKSDPDQPSPHLAPQSHHGPWEQTDPELVWPPDRRAQVEDLHILELRGRGDGQEVLGRAWDPLLSTAHHPLWLLQDSLC